MINDISKKVDALFPHANLPGIGAGGLTNNYQRRRDPHDRSPQLRRQGELQPDGRPSDLGQVQLHGRRGRRPHQLSGARPNASGDGGFTKVYQATAGQTWTLGSTGVWDANVRLLASGSEGVWPDFQAGNFGLMSWASRAPTTTGSAISGTPAIRSSTPASVALGNRDGWNPIFRDERTYSFATNFTKLKGRHELRGGYMVNYLWLSHWQPETGNPRGGSPSRKTRRRSRRPVSNFYNQYAAFLLGLVGSTSDAVNKSVQDVEMTGREWQHAFYMRDRWNLSDKLTLDLGLRWEYYPIMQRENHGSNGWISARSK
jgi:hypothetical protein